MLGQRGPTYLIAGAVGAAVSVYAGTALGAYAAGGIDPFYGRPRLIAAAPSAQPEAPRLWTAAASDLDGQWPVGSLDQDRVSETW